jgi:hypothetical protein
MMKDNDLKQKRIQIKPSTIATTN